MAEADVSFLDEIAQDLATGPLVGRLGQDEAWLDINGRVHRLSDMSPQYAANVIAFLERNASALHADARDEALSCGPPRGEEARRAFDAEQDFIFRSNSLTWLRATPLVEALTAIVEP